MNSLKPLILLVILGGVAFGVYRLLSRDSSAPPPGADALVAAAPEIKLGDVESSASKDRTKSAGPNLLRPQAGGAAPPFDPLGNSADKAGSLAPPHVPEAGHNHGAGESMSTSVPAVPTNTAGVQPHESSAASSAHPSAHAAGALASGEPGGTLGRQPGTGADSFAAAWSVIEPRLAAGELAAALKDLSAWHDHPSLNASQRDMVSRLLGQLAGTVIYSREHMFAAPYRVQPGEQLADIAEKFKVTPELLAKINELDPAAATLAPGAEIKVVRGPFSAILDVGADRLTLLIDGCYAGSFAVAEIGSDVSARVQRGTPVEFTVSQKTTAPIYNSPQGEIDAGAPANPLGERLVALGSELAIHGTNPNASPTTRQPSAGVRLSGADIVDVYDILTVGSRVVIRK